jgi:hypothetical protein
MSTRSALAAAAITLAAAISSFMPGTASSARPATHSARIAGEPKNERPFTHAAVQTPRNPYALAREFTKPR